MNFTNLFFQSCSRFIDDLSSHYPTGQRPISEHGEFEEAGHGVIKNFKKIAKKEYERPLHSNKKISQFAPDHHINEVTEASSGKSKFPPSKHSHLLPKTNLKYLDIPKYRKAKRKFTENDEGKELIICRL